MRRKTGRTVGLLLWGALLLINGSPSHAQVSSVTNYGDAVGGGTKITYFDLLKKIFPDVVMGTTGGEAAAARTTIPLNHLFGEYKGQVYRGEMKISDVERLGGPSKSKKQVLLLVHVDDNSGELFNWGKISVLALFQLEPTVTLLDAADVQADQSASFWDEKPSLPIGPQQDAAIIANTHHNSSQGYLSLALVSTETDKLRTIFELPVLFHANDCGHNLSQTPSISALKGARRAHFNISIKVKLVKEPDDASCEKRTKGFTKYYRTTLVWNSSKRVYESRGNALEQLSRFNGKLF